MRRCAPAQAPPRGHGLFHPCRSRLPQSQAALPAIRARSTIRSVPAQLWLPSPDPAFTRPLAFTGTSGNDGETSRSTHFSPRTRKFGVVRERLQFCCNRSRSRGFCTHAGFYPLRLSKDLGGGRGVLEKLDKPILEEPYKLLVQSIVDYAIFMLDPEGSVTNWNAGAERIKGYSPDEIVGSHFSRFYTPEDLDAGIPKRALETARKTGRYEAEGWRVRKDGTRFWASVVLDAIRDEQGDLIGFAKITRDMTEKREAQLRLAESREQLWRSQKMEALGQLTGGLAHDFNNLLTAILGASELAMRNIDNPDKVRRMLDGVRNSAHRGASLTKQLLAFARAQPLEMK